MPVLLGVKEGRMPFKYVHKRVIEILNSPVGVAETDKPVVVAAALSPDQENRNRKGISAVVADIDLAPFYLVYRYGRYVP